MFRSFQFTLGKFFLRASLYLGRVLSNAGWRLVAYGAQNPKALSDFAKEHFSSLGVEFRVISRETLESAENPLADPNEESEPPPKRTFFS